MAEERVYTIPLGKVYDSPRTKRGRIAATFVRKFIARNMKVKEENVKISGLVNADIWRHGMKKPPRRIKVKIIKDGDIVRAFTIDEKIAKEEPKKKEEKKEIKKEEKKETAKTEEKEAPKTEVKAEEKKAEQKPEEKKKD